MLTVNADDWGGCKHITDAALRCYREKRITSVSAMVFMQDSERAAELANTYSMDAGLHLNFTEPYTGEKSPAVLTGHQQRIRGFLQRGKYAFLFYNPLLRESFRIVYQCQYDEFVRLYKKPPTHIDGHQHMHLCTNMLVDAIIPIGQRVRRSFSFRPGEKGVLNRSYRMVVDRRLAQRYKLSDYFFCLTDCIRDSKLPWLQRLAKSADVELMTHPAADQELKCLMSDEFQVMLQRLEVGSYALV